jgi:glutathione S-transferase
MLAFLKHSLPTSGGALKLYMTERSGNAYKVRLLLSMLDVAYEPVHVDLAHGENREPAFLRLNPRGQVPVLEDDGAILWDSTALLVYIARKHDDGRWLPHDGLSLARVMQWMALAQNELRYGLQAAYVMLAYGRPGHLEEHQALGRAGLQVLEGRLADREWLELDRPTLADIACYPYPARAPHALIPLEPYPAVRAWINRFEALEGWFE